MNKQFLSIILILLFISGCEKAPAKRFINPEQPATGTWGDEWVIYDNELRTGGNVMFYNTLEGQEFTLTNGERPHSGQACIKYSWDGRSVYTYSLGSSQYDYCGFSFIVADKTADYSAKTKDFTPSNYKKITFWARGELNSGVSLRLESNNGNSNSPSGSDAILTTAITSEWKYFEFNVSLNTAAKDFVKIVLKYDEDGNSYTPNTIPGNGATVFIDDIKLTK